MMIKFLLVGFRANFRISLIANDAVETLTCRVNGRSDD